MLTNLLFGLSTMTLCLLLQTLLLISAIRYYAQHKRLLSNSSFWSSLIVLKGVMLLLIIGNLAQVMLWGLLFLLLDEFGHFSEAFYHSAVNFSTLGYGDIVMSAEHRLLGPLEAINGALMIGVSTAVLTAAFQDVMKRILRARQMRR